MKPQLTLGVIGHVDHGKTALVRALTGVETDRLKEERERGLSIVLGFAHLELDDSVVDFIDVPGHEDFIRMMISGATGIDGVILVLAANESVMPQTREHFEIARLLGIERGVIVMTKTDLVSDEALAVAEQGARDLVAGSFLQDAALIYVSAVTGDGIDSLIAELPSLLGSKADDDVVDSCFLPIDRVFAMSGFGTVVTGTLRRGCLKEKQAVELLPGGRTATVRALQNHSEPVEIAYPGQRVAVNLRGVEREDVERGDVLASTGFLRPTRRLDVHIELLSAEGSELKNGQTIRLLVGTSAVIARVRLLGQNVLKAGETGYAQLRCQADVVTHRDERFILRSVSPAHTMGGGRILVVNAERHQRFDDAMLERLERTAATDSQAVFEARLADAGVAGLKNDAIQQELGLADDAFADAIDRAGAVRIDELHVVDKAIYSALLTDIVATLDGYHAAHPKQQGLAAAALSHELETSPESKILRHAVAELTESGELVMEGGVLHRPGFDPLGGLPAGERAMATKLEQRFLADGLNAPDVDAVKKSAPGLQQLFRLLLDTGTLVRLKTYDRKSGMVLHRKVLSAIEQQLEERFPHPQTFTVAEVRDLLNATRKSVVPLMEHLDSTGATVRDGNVRRLRKR
jgi:selenocysteine-specific elongation factor